MPDFPARISVARLLMEVEAAPVVRVEVDSGQFYNAPIVPLLMVISYGARLIDQGTFLIAQEDLFSRNRFVQRSHQLLYKAVVSTIIFAVQSKVVDVVYSVDMFQVSPNGII